MHINFRKANRSDVPQIVRLLAEDNIGITRERFTEPLQSSYYAAFETINADKNN